MRRIRYQVACSLDGYIAGPDGEYDWITPEPEIDFEEVFEGFDTLLMGRKTWEQTTAGGGDGWGKEVVVFSRTLRPEDHPGLTIVSDGVGEFLDDLRSRPGKDIWLFGGGELFRSLLEIGQVDAVEPAVVPILLGDGVPFLPTPAARAALTLRGHRVYPTSGIVVLEYAVDSGAARARRISEPAS